MKKRLLKEDTVLKIGDVLLFRNRFNKDKYAILQITEIMVNYDSNTNTDIDVGYYSTVLASSGYYTKGNSYYWDKGAHCNQHRSSELTYYLPHGTLLYGKE